MKLELRATLADGAVYGVGADAPPHDAELEPLVTVAWRDVASGTSLARAVEEDLASALAPGSVLVDREPVEFAGVDAVRTFALHLGPGGRPTAAEQWRLLAAGRCWTVSALSALADQPSWGPLLASAAATLPIG